MNETLIRERRRKIISFIGITAAVYLSFRYLLPLVVPFLCALIAANLLWPPVDWMRRKLHIREGLGISLLLTLITAALLAALWLVGKALWGQCLAAAERLPVWLTWLDGFLRQLCGRIQTGFSLPAGTLDALPDAVMDQINSRLPGEFFGWCVGSSAELLSCLSSAIVSWLVGFMAVIFITQEREQLKNRFCASSFYMETRILGDKLEQAGGSWIKVQLIIMGLTSIICTGGFWLMRYPYPLLAGIGVGIFDALPLFGSGAIFIPWMIWKLFQRQWLGALCLLLLYALCYFTREFLENRMMGDSMGITALEFLASVYIGLKLFGGAGFILGPVGYIIIRTGMLLIL